MLKTLNKNRKQRWHETINRLDFTRSSHKAWGLTKKLGGRNARTTPQIKTIKSEDIASRLVKGEKVNMNKTFGKEIKEKLKKAKKELSPKSDYGCTFFNTGKRNSAEKDKIAKTSRF